MIVNVFAIDLSTVNGGYTPAENPISLGLMTHALNELLGIPVQYIYISHIMLPLRSFQSMKGMYRFKRLWAGYCLINLMKIRTKTCWDMKLHEITNHEILNSDFVPNICEYHLQWSWEVEMVNINRYWSNQLGLRIMPPAGHSGAFRKRSYPNASRIRTFSYWNPWFSGLLHFKKPPMDLSMVWPVIPWHIMG